MRHPMKSLGAALCAAGIAGLAACGGAADPDERHSQADVTRVAALGMTSSMATVERVAGAFEWIGSALQEQSMLDGPGASLADQPCDVSGTYSVRVTKSAPRMGLAAGDQLGVTYAKCKFKRSNFLLDGSFTATLESDAVGLKKDEFSIVFQAETAAFATTSEQGGPAKGVVGMTGTVRVAHSVSPANSGTLQFVVPASGRLTANLGAGKDRFFIAYGPGTAFSSKFSRSTFSGSHKLDGTLDTGANGEAGVSLAVATPEALTFNDPFTPSSGVVKAASADLATSTTVNAGNARVSGDTDGNGSLDLSFDLRWQELVTR